MAFIATYMLDPKDHMICFKGDRDGLHVLLHAPAPAQQTHGHGIVSCPCSFFLPVRTSEIEAVLT